MKKRILGFLSLPLFFLVGCTNKDVALSGTITTKEVEIEDVSSLEVYNINLKSGFSSFGAKIVCLNDDSKKKRAVITASSDLIEKVSIKESGATLKISASSHERYLTDNCEIYLYNCVFNSINLASATQMIANDGTLREDKLDIDLNGASSLEINKLSLNEIDVDLSGASSFKASKIELNDASFDLSGASNVQIESLIADDIELSLAGASSFKASGSVDKIEVDASGASKVDMINVSSSKVSGHLSGASSGFFSFRGSLKLDLSGASTLYYLGDSSSLDVSTSGGSSVKKYN